MSARPITVLIVEDDCLTRMGYRLALEEEGYTVVASARTGEQAIGFVRRYHPSHVIIDIRLKGPMDGIELAYELERGHPCLVIFATGVADQDTLRTLAGMKSVAVLIKPIRLGAFSDVIGFPPVDQRPVGRPFRHA